MKGCAKPVQSGAGHGGREACVSFRTSERRRGGRELCIYSLPDIGAARERAEERGTKRRGAECVAEPEKSAAERGRGNEQSERGKERAMTEG